MNAKTWWSNGYTYTRQQVGNVVMIRALDCRTGIAKVEIYKVQRNGLEIFQGYANSDAL